MKQRIVKKGKPKLAWNLIEAFWTQQYDTPLCGLSVQGRMKGEESKAALTDDMGHLLKKKRRLAGGFCEMLIRRNDPPPQSWLYVAEVPTWRPSMALAF